MLTFLFIIRFISIIILLSNIRLLSVFRSSEKKSDKISINSLDSNLFLTFAINIPNNLIFLDTTKKGRELYRVDTKYPRKIWRIFKLTFPLL